MALTKIQPSGIDSTKDYAVDQLTANTVVVSGVNVLNQANTAITMASDFNPLVFLTSGM